MQKIMFNDKYGLTQAVLEGRKTLTRRIAFSGDIKSPHYGFLTEGTDAGKLALCDKGFIVAKSSYRFGEVVAVAQNLRDMGYDPRDTRHKSGAIWGLDHTPAWTNKMFVSASECIHQLRITNVRLEHLKDISDEDCMKEGVGHAQIPFGYYVNGINRKHPYYEPDTGFRWEKESFNTSREAFAALIDKVSGKGTWESNPLVFVYEFELVR